MKLEEELLIYGQTRDLEALNRTNMEQNGAKTLPVEIRELERRVKGLEDAFG